MQIKALLFASLASSAMAQTACTPNATYCGWGLVYDLGWGNTTDTEGLWHCNEGGNSATYLKHCAFNCTGPNAACAPNPTDPEPTTTTTTTEPTGKPTWTGGWGKPGNGKPY